MLEIPDSYNIALQLAKMLRGKTILNAYANTSPHGFAWYFDDPEGYQNVLGGRTVEGARAVGGMVEIIAQDARIVLCDGINIRYLSPGEKQPPKHQLLVEFNDFSAIVCTVSMYGGLWAYREGENNNGYYLGSLEKPNPLTEDFDEAYFRSLLVGLKPRLSAKAVLATEQRIPGLGNGVLQDILFNARINPRTRLEALTEADLGRMYRSVKDTLMEMTARGGRDTEKDLFGCPGGYRTKLSAKTWKEPCPVCGDTIVRQAFLGGNIYYCPTCQPLAEAK